MEDLGFLARRVAKRCDVPLAKASGAVAAYKKYVGLHMMEPFNPHPMSGLVDEVWHEHILHTREYGDFCQRVVGWFLHHVPNREDDEGTTTSEGTQARLAELFGPTDPLVWASVAPEMQTLRGQNGRTVATAVFSAECGGNCADAPETGAAFRADCGGGCGSACGDEADAALLQNLSASAFRAECGGGCAGGGDIRSVSPAPDRRVSLFKADCGGGCAGCSDSPALLDGNKRLSGTPAAAA
jgi:hypothetical protein